MEKQTICLNGRLKEGDLVVAAPNGDYSCLIGCVKGICYVGTPEHDEMTDNPTDDVLVDFSNDYSDKRLVAIVEQFRCLYEDDEKTLEDIGFDSIVMSPSELLKIDIEKVGEKYYSALLDSEIQTAEWCFIEFQNFIASRPRAMVYEVVTSYRLEGEEVCEKLEFNTECSAYEYACEQYVQMLEKFDGLPNSYRCAGETGDSLFFAGGIKTDDNNKDCYSVRLNKYRWIKTS